MGLKRYELYGSHAGVLEQESECGTWVSAADAQAEIDRLTAESSKLALHLAGAVMLLRRVRNRLPVDTEIFEKVNRFLMAEIGSE